MRELDEFVNTKYEIKVVKDLEKMSPEEVTNVVFHMCVMGVIYNDQENENANRTVNQCFVSINTETITLKVSHFFIH